MLGEDVGDEQFDEFGSVVGFVAGNEYGLLGEATNDDENGIVAFGGG